MPPSSGFPEEGGTDEMFVKTLKITTKDKAENAFSRLLCSLMNSCSLIFPIYSSHKRDGNLKRTSFMLFLVLN